MLRLGTWLTIAGFALSFVACNGDTRVDCESDCGGIPPLNTIPVAQVEGPAEINLDGTVTLDASGSSDKDKDKLTFLWKESEANPANNFFDGVDLTADKITFKADVEGEFSYEVRVRDDDRNEDTATFTLKVTKDFVPPNLKAPVVTGVTINGTTIMLADNPMPTAFTVAAGSPITVRVIGTDEDQPEGTPLIEQYSAHFTSDTFWPAAHYQAATDDDGFATIETEVWLKDADGLFSPHQKVRFAIVPRANTDLTARAVFVDCTAALDGAGTAASPRNLLQDAYDQAKTDGVDLYVATGVCQEPLRVTYENAVNLYGLFDRSNHWHRRTSVADRLIDRTIGSLNKFANPTVITHSASEALLSTNGAGGTTGFLKIDGFAFELGGSNQYAIALTTPNADTVRIDIQNNEFTGEVTQNTLGYVSGGIHIQRGINGSSNGATFVLRNFFAVTGPTETSFMQAHVFPGILTTLDAGSVHFFGNVFYGWIGQKSTDTYSCHPASGNQPFAFCFYNYSQSTNCKNWAGTSLVCRAHVGRNTFWAQSAITNPTSTSAPVIMSSGKGKTDSFLNLFFTSGNQNNIRIAHVSDDTSTGAALIDGIYAYSAFPKDIGVYYLLVTSRTTGAILGSSQNYTCLAATNNDFGSGTSASCTESTLTSMNAFGSYAYYETESTQGSVQLWRFNSASFVDRATKDEVDSATFYDLPQEAMFDFDGFYGAYDNDGDTVAEFNTGAFEAP